MTLWKILSNPELKAGLVEPAVERRAPVTLPSLKVQLVRKEGEVVRKTDLTLHHKIVYTIIFEIKAMLNFKGTCPRHESLAKMSMHKSHPEGHLCKGFEEGNNDILYGTDPPPLKKPR